MNYWLIYNGSKLGPMSLEQVRAMQISPDTPVWRTGLPDWDIAANFPELVDSLSARPEITPPAIPLTEEPEPMQSTCNGPAFFAPAYEPESCSRPAIDIPPMPNTYLAWSIIVTVLCCIPAGIVAIIFSSQVESRYRRGEYDRADAASENALLWIIASVVLGLLITPLQIIWAML